MKRLVLGVGLAVTLLGPVGPGCRKEAPADPPRKPGLVVLARGEAPRVALRYRFQPKATVRYRLTTERRRLHVPDPGTQAAVVLSYYVDRVKGPRAQVRWRVEPAAAAKGPRRPAESIWLQLDHRGRVEASRVRGASADRAAALKPLLRTLTARWPEPAVGVGARWRDRRRARLPLRAGARRSGLDTEVETRYRFDRIAPCGRSRCAFIGLDITLWSQHRHRQATIFGTGHGRGEVAFDLDRGLVVSIHTRSELSLSTHLHRSPPLERIRLVQTLEEVRGGTRPTTP